MRGTSTAFFTRATVLTLALLLAFKPCFAQTPAPSGGPAEGIKVHGHWTIEVRDPDGTLVTHREFEKA